MEQEPDKSPTAFKVALALIFVDALLWFCFGVLCTFNLHPSIPTGGFVRWIMAFLALLTSFVLLGLGILLRRRQRLALPTSLVLLSLISVLTLTDQIGIADIAVLTLHLAPLALLVQNRRWFLQT